MGNIELSHSNLTLISWFQTYSKYNINLLSQILYIFTDNLINDRGVLTMISAYFFPKQAIADELQNYAQTIEALHNQAGDLGEQVS